ncbi:DUF1482 family protein [Enterobacter cloacae]|uniref:DUF1482 family protein n=1 Tax=Enterobacter cloacae TaxID=550 RepID=UPI00396A4299
MTPLFALVLTICSSTTNCSQVVKEIYDTEAQCNQVIYEHRYFNGDCFEVEKIIHSDGTETSGY